MYKLSEVRLHSVCEVSRDTVVSFCAKWHYSHTLPGCKHYYGLFYKGHLIGMAGLGVPAMRHQAGCYTCDIELRRLCLIDDAPRNSESHFIGFILRDLAKKGYYAVLSLADPEHGHCGTIYRAANFEFLGEERGGGSRLIFIDGKEVHSRSAFVKYGTSGINSLKQLLGSDRVSGRNKKRKYVYRYVLR